MEFEDFVEDLDDVGAENGHPGELLDRAQEHDDEEGFVDLGVFVELAEEDVGVLFSAEKEEIEK